MQKITQISLPNWERITIQTANFFFSESEKRLQESVTTYTTNKEAAYKILGIILPIITIAAGYIFNANLLSDFRKLIPSLIFIVIQMAGAGFVVWSLFIRTVQTIGTMPALLIQDDLIIPDNGDLQYVGIILNQCENIQDRIDNNIGVNARCANNTNIALIICGIVAPTAFIIASLFLL